MQLLDAFVSSDHCGYLSQKHTGMAPTGNFVFCYGAFAMGDFYLEEINNIGTLGFTKRGCFC